MRTSMLGPISPRPRDAQSPEPMQAAKNAEKRRKTTMQVDEPTEDWGTAEQIDGAVAALHEVIASRRALVPYSLLWHVAALVRRHQGSKTALLMHVRRLCESHWRRAAVSDFVARRLVTRDLFTTWKTIDMLRYDRTPSDVSEGFVRAVGDVGEHAVVARDIFWQRFRPLVAVQSGVAASGKVLLIAPGLGETGRNFYDQIAQLNRLGHEVVVMDQQWAGQTRHVDGHLTPGMLDRGFGAVRDVARVAEYVARQLPTNGKLILMGQGTGGTAILMLLVAQAARLIDVALPERLDAVLQAPYLAPAPRGINRLLRLLSCVPGLRDVPAGLLFPNPTADAVAAKKYAQCRVRDHVILKLSALRALRADLQTTWSMVAQGHKPMGRVAVLHSAGDPWADAAASHRLTDANILGRNAAVRILPGAHHALAHSASERQETLWGLQKVGVSGPSSRAAALQTS